MDKTRVENFTVDVSEVYAGTIDSILDALHGVKSIYNLTVCVETDSNYQSLRDNHIDPILDAIEGMGIQVENYSVTIRE